MPSLQYPISAQVNQTDNYHGTILNDPYRWLEDVDSPETLNWIEAQNKLTFSYLEQIPLREQIRQRLTALWDFARAQAPVKRGGYFFQLRNSGLQNQDVLYVYSALDAEPRCLIDPNTLSADGTVALTNWEVSQDGHSLAYATSASGSDWLTWRVRDVTTGEDLPDLIQWSKFSEAAWLPDSSGFYYAAYDAPQPGQEYEGTNYFQKLYLHNLGEAQTSDILVYSRPDQKEWGFSPKVSEDGRFLIISVWLGTDTRNRLFYQDLQAQAPVVELISELEAGYQFIGNDGDLFYFRTDLDAPCGRLIAINITNPDRHAWLTLVPECEDVLEGITMVNDQFVAIYMHHAHHEIHLFDNAGSHSGEISLPTLGSILQFNSLGINGSRSDQELFFAFHSFLVPATVYRYDFIHNQLDAIFSPAINFDPGPYDTRQIFVTGIDGTKIPLFLIHRRDLQFSGKNPTLLYGYGGFNIALMPTFAISRLAWLELGGVLAVANLRGGGEYGEQWHHAGMFERKQNVFDDFIACAEYLIESKITSTPKLAIQGGSNGGLLVGACMTQRPDLFGAALPAVGVMDMLRFHKFTIGWAWTSEYGSADDPDQFNTLIKYSPLHNFRQGQAYPATLITTADHDDRVVPGHSFKFAAALQAAQSGEAPILIRIQTKAGHGAGKPTAILIEEYADVWAFLAKVLEVTV